MGAMFPYRVVAWIAVLALATLVDWLVWPASSAAGGGGNWSMSGSGGGVDQRSAVRGNRKSAVFSGFHIPLYRR